MIEMAVCQYDKRRLNPFISHKIIYFFGLCTRIYEEYFALGFDDITIFSD